MRRLLPAVLLLLCTLTLSAQERPRLAIIPLNYIEVPKTVALALTGLLETGLVNTEMCGVTEWT